MVVQQYSRRLLKMDILMPETCWVSKKWSKYNKSHLVGFLFFNYHNDARSNKHQIANFDVLLTVHLGLFILVINQLDVRNFYFTMRLFHASTCFEHMWSSSGGQNCITQPVVSSCVWVCNAINQFDVRNFCFTIRLFHASTCFEHMCSSSGGQNCVTQPVVSSYL